MGGSEGVVQPACARFGLTEITRFATRHPIRTAVDHYRVSLSLTQGDTTLNGVRNSVRKIFDGLWEPLVSSVTVSGICRRVRGSSRSD
jgi:hypothetical protein